jgi:hypothetical protein
MKCANCKNDAVYIYRITADVFTPYCLKDLPKFLSERRKAGLLETTEEYKKMMTEVTPTLADNFKEPVVEEPSVPKKQAPKKTEE